MLERELCDQERFGGRGHGGGVDEGQLGGTFGLAQHVQARDSQALEQEVVRTYSTHIEKYEEENKFQYLTHSL